jgi:hypothetical protein
MSNAGKFTDILAYLESIKNESYRRKWQTNNTNTSFEGWFFLDTMKLCDRYNVSHLWLAAGPREQCLFPSDSLHPNKLSVFLSILSSSLSSFAFSNSAKYSCWEHPFLISHYIFVSHFHFYRSFTLKVFIYVVHNFLLSYPECCCYPSQMFHVFFWYWDERMFRPCCTESLITRNNGKKRGECRYWSTGWTPGERITWYCHERVSESERVGECEKVNVRELVNTRK